jgi:ATP-dependent RNA helicase DeaD
MTKEPDSTPVKLTEEAPMPMKRDRNRFGNSNNRQRNGRGTSGKKEYSNKRTNNRKPSGSSNGNRSTGQKREQFNK